MVTLGFQESLHVRLVLTDGAEPAHGTVRVRFVSEESRQLGRVVEALQRGSGEARVAAVAETRGRREPVLLPLRRHLVVAVKELGGRQQPLRLGAGITHRDNTQG